MIKKKRDKKPHEKVARLINNIRIKHNMTFRAMATEMDVSEVTLHRWINGENKPHRKNMKELERININGPKN